MEILKVNGVEKQFAGGIPETLTELLKQLGIRAETVVAEIDGEIIERSKFTETRLCPGQSIELIRFVGGGQFYG